ncbi:MAG: BACON domain-containing protein [Bacteroidales bacterium]|nr:BACON domain-containing protein [Bacteroidales bacterium]
MKKTLYNVGIVLGLAASLAACEKTEDRIERDVDSVSVSCRRQDLQHWVLATGAWTSENDVPWITLSPDSGTGDGKNFQPYTIRVAYNSDETSRTGTFYLVHNGTRCPVTVIQAACSFSYGTIDLSGSLIRNEASEAFLQVPYTDASGEEQVTFSVTLDGASEGLSVADRTFTLNEGSGVASLAITGTPTQFGTVSFTVSADGKPLGTVTAEVTHAGGAYGLPCEWKFADTKDADYSAVMKEKHPEWAASHIYQADVNTEATLSVTEAAGKTLAAVSGWGYNDGHCYIKGLQKDDSFLMTVPVSGLTAGSSIGVSGSVGGSGSGAGYFLVEYSLDGSTWTAADNASTETVGTETFPYHAAAKDSYLQADGAFSASFVLPGDFSGTLGVRIRVCANVRVNHASTIPIATGGGGSNRLKGTLSIHAL